MGDGPCMNDEIQVHDTLAIMTNAIEDETCMND
jgi:hypothetical protein